MLQSQQNYTQHEPMMMAGWRADLLLRWFSRRCWRPHVDNLKPKLQGGVMIHRTHRMSKMDAIPVPFSFDVNKGDWTSVAWLFTRTSRTSSMTKLTNSDARIGPIRHHPLTPPINVSRGRVIRGELQYSTSKKGIPPIIIIHSKS